MCGQRAGSVGDGDDDLAAGRAGGDGGQALGGVLQRQHRGHVDGEGAGGRVLGQRGDDLAGGGGHDVAAGQTPGGRRLVVGGAEGGGDQVDQRVDTVRVGGTDLLGYVALRVVDDGGRARLLTRSVSAEVAVAATVTPRAVSSCTA